MKAYLSCIKSHLSDTKHWAATNDVWYSGSYKLLGMRATINAKKNGDLDDYSYETMNPIRRSTASKLNHLLINDGPTPSNKMAPFEKACIIAITRASAGRGGECAYCSWDDTNFIADDETLETWWFEEKTAKHHCMLFTPDFKSWALDVFVMLFCHTVTSTDTNLLKDVDEDDNFYIFPRLIYQAVSTKGASVSKEVTNIIRQASGRVEFINSRSTSHKLRYGAIDDMQRNVNCPVFGIVERSGHAEKHGETTALRYFEKRRNK